MSTDHTHGFSTRAIHAGQDADPTTGATVVPIPCHGDDEFVPDPAVVASLITPRTRMIIVNSPANPTGRVATESEMRDIARLAAERNVLLVSDEIYPEGYDSRWPQKCA